MLKSEEIQREVKTLSTFYSEHAERWRMLVQFARGAVKTLEKPVEKPHMVAVYERFQQISIPAPIPILHR